MLSPSQQDNLLPSAEEVHVWSVDLDVPEVTADELFATLSTEERSRCARLRFERDRQRFIVAHGALRELIACYLEIRSEQVRYAYNPFGKPRLSRVFGDRLRFSLSHSSGLALIAFAADAEVGIDVECIDVQFDVSDTAALFLSTAEAGYLMSIPKPRRAVAFLDCWTKKEAFLKASGEGLSQPLADFSVPLGKTVAHTPVNFLSSPNMAGRCRIWSMYSLTPEPGYIGALAIEGGSRRMSLRAWQPAFRPDAPGRISA